jgi:hypothetical protein
MSRFIGRRTVMISVLLVWGKGVYASSLTTVEKLSSLYLYRVKWGYLRQASKHSVARGDKHRPLHSMDRHLAHQHEDDQCKLSY